MRANEHKNSVWSSKVPNRVTFWKSEVKIILIYGVGLPYYLYLFHLQKKIVIPKDNRHNIAFFFGITHFWGADIIRRDKVFLLGAFLH